MATNIIGLKELRQNTEKYIRDVAKGKSFIVARKSKPIFKLSPAESESMWEEVVDFTAIKKDGVPAHEVLAALKELDG